MNIYRNITYILYLFLFVPVFEGSAMMYVAKGSALSEDATHKLLAGTFDVGSLTCILIGRPLELRPSGITPDDLKLGGEKADRAVGGGAQVHVTERFVEDLPNQKTDKSILILK